jgi:DNA-binding transcriptional MerR regulator
MPKVETKVSSMRAAARIVGVSAATIRRWVNLGTLPTGPWTQTQLKRAGQKSASVRRGVTTAEHGTLSRYRAGCECDICTAAHIAETRASLERRRRAEMNTVEPELLTRLSRGDAYRDVLDALEITAQLVTAHRRRDEAFSARLDRALLEGRRDDLNHGTGLAWKVGCRCPECRSHHEASR